MDFWVRDIDDAPQHSGRRFIPYTHVLISREQYWTTNRVQWLPVAISLPCISYDWKGCNLHLEHLSFPRYQCYLRRTYLIHSVFLWGPTLNLDHFLAGWPNSLALSVATWIPRAIADRTRPSSIASRPAIVQPAGATIIVRLRNKDRNSFRTCYSIFELRRMRTTMQDHSSCTLQRCQIFNG